MKNLSHLLKKGHLVLTKFDGDGEDEDKIKEETGASTRCIPFNIDIKVKNENCFYTNKKTDRVVIFTRAY